MSGAPITVASNRLPFSYQRTAKGLERRPSPGGLVSALEPVLRKRGGTWVGWPGIALRKGEVLDTEVDDYRIAPVALGEGDINRYYHGFSNRTLWPLFHSMTDRATFERRDFDVYEEVNDRFADAVIEAAGDGDEGLVWIHDYHLLLVPRRIRERDGDTPLAFFLHVPFPPFDIFRLLPWDREILRSMLACDLIGFHVRGYVQNFFDCAERTLGARVDRSAGIVEYGTRTTRVGAFPIGIEFRGFEKLAQEAPPRPPGRERIVLGVDRLDYTKGIPHRIRAFSRLLELYPDLREQVVLLQLAVPSRSQVTEYRELKREIDELVGSVNGRFATARWSPIRYLYRSVQQDRLAGLYRDADVALVTPLRDGMNLVAKEFVACQVADPGVLVLSRLAGAADTMREALLVNPNDIDGTADAIHRALVMDEGERASRAEALRARERRDDLDAWTRSFLEQAAAERASIVPMSDADFDEWLGDFLKKRRRLALFLDYDGTLTPLCEHPDEARLSPAMRRALQSCSRRADTDVAIISGRSLEGIRKIVGEQVLTYAGNHGLEIEGLHLDPFVHEDLVHYRERADVLADELDAIAQDGAWTERKGPTLTFHYRAVPEHEREGLVSEARELISRAGYQPRDAHCAVEARPPIGWDKGRAVLHVLRARYGPAWSESVRVVYVGDDQTDEDAFRFLSGLAETFRVGSPDTPTAATRRLPDTDAVQALLEWIGRRPEAA